MVRRAVVGERGGEHDYMVEVLAWFRRDELALGTPVVILPAADFDALQAWAVRARGLLERGRGAKCESSECGECWTCRVNAHLQAPGCPDV